ncbi:hypothetical protein PIB30_088726, partial [Stylosanthes scabra]|nr:hypothetical protein [Stylosanthes scabra]
LCMMSFITKIYASATSQCLSHQQFMLLSMKHSLIFNSSTSTKLVHWNQTSAVDCCQWNGVKCNNNGHVIGLDLSQESISGGLQNSSSLFNFKHLHTLNLAFNDFGSLIPSDIRKLKNLRHLNLSNAGFRGQIPKGIFKIQTLKVLDVSNNEALEGSFPEFPKNGQLETLILSYTNFSGQLVSSISNLKQLSTLDLSNCQFNGTLPVSLSELTNLVHLDLSYNRFTGPLPYFNNSKSLQYLSLLQNELTGEILSTHWEELSNLCTVNLGDNFFSGKIPKSLFTLSSLQEVTLSNNGFEGILDEFQNTTSSTLELVDLSINKLEGPIPLSFFGLKRLTLLNLSWNKFNGTIQLDTIHKKLPYLNVLGLSNNKLSVEITDDDTSSLSFFPTLTNVLLASCNLKKFPSFLKNQPKLYDLDLSNNLIQGPIPKWIWKFDSMVSLNLSNNLLTDLEGGPFENPHSSLLMLDLHSNQIRGSIPYFTKYATHLDFSNNKFSFIPPHIAQYLPFMFILSLSNNSFHGKIPESFCNSSTIRLLDLSHNNFDGPIPKCLVARNHTLRVLNLAGNKLTGHIHDTIFSSTCNLRYLDLNANLLRGTIPKSLVNCQMLEVLNLGNNFLSDEFPCFLGNITTLSVLVLRSNKLHGPIHCNHNTSHWKMLRVVDLASNNFTGTLPGALLQSWTAMMDDGNYIWKDGGYLFFNMYDFPHYIHYKDMLAIINIAIIRRLAKIFANDPPSRFEDMLNYAIKGNQFQYSGTYLDSVTVVNKGLQMKLEKILSIFTSLDFSSNSFEGPIPEELMSLKALIVLNISHNSLSGHISSSLIKLTALESLDLSSNSLSGEIPTEISSLSFLSVLNLSYNHLVGRIPTGTQIQSFDMDSFEGNGGLCGPPLTKNCGGDDGVQEGLSPAPSATSETHNNSIDWNFLSAELGFTFGIGVIIFPLIFWKRWRMRYFKYVDNLLWRIFPRLDFVYEQDGQHKYRTLRWISA